MLEKVIITGISGFVGTNLCTYLRHNYNILGISRKPKRSNEKAFSDFNLEIMNSSKAIIHLAGKAHDMRKGSFDNEYYEANTDLTINIFDKFLKSDCKIFIYLSSVKAVADKVDGFLTEGHNPNPITVYGKSKLKAEQYILSKKIPDSKKIYILRPCMIHGPKNKGNLNILYNVVNKNIPYPLGKLKNKRSFLSINNLCFVIEKLIEKKPDSGVYNVADDIAISTTELVKLIGEVIKKRILILNIPMPIIKKLALLGDKIGLQLNTEKLEKLTGNYCVSNVKIKNAIKEALPLNIYDGLRITITSFKDTKRDD